MVVRLAWVFPAPICRRSCAGGSGDQARPAVAKRRCGRLVRDARDRLARAALALPLTLTDGSPFPGARSLVFLAFVVIFVR